jgi:ring-1,2-phenylacetyl-CoA epoxidase subunit PaaD
MVSTGPAAEKMGSDPVFDRIPVVDAELVADRESQRDPALAALWAALEDVKDPEIPVISVRELGVLRRLERIEDGICVTITPTWSGCPAMHAMEIDIRQRLAALGMKHVEVRTRLGPAWTTDWITESARESLRAFGIAPPARTSSDPLSEDPEPRCPQCGSADTRRVSEYGSTACKALWQCRSCTEPFDAFKRI